jgi:hypothetical protein
LAARLWALGSQMAPALGARGSRVTAQMDAPTAPLNAQTPAANIATCLTKLPTIEL